MFRFDVKKKSRVLAILGLFIGSTKGAGGAGLCCTPL